MIKLTKHYKDRYKERVSKSSKKMQLLADKAFEFGTDLDEIQNSKMKKMIKNRNKGNAPWVKCKIYRGYVWWFSATTILTVYALPIIHNAYK
jgi:hypothetical protein